MNIDPITLTLVWHGPAEKGADAKEYRRRDSTALIKIGAQKGNWEGGKVNMKRRVRNNELKGASIETTNQEYELQVGPTL